MLIPTKVLLTICCCLFTFAALAQERPHKLSLKAGYGVASIPHIFHNFMSFGAVEWETTSVSGPWQAGVSYRLSRKLEVGLVASKTTIKQDGRYRPDPGQVPSPDDDKVVRKETSKYHSFMPFINIYWQNTGKVQFYSGYAQGWGTNKTEEWSTDGRLQKDIYRSFTFQITAAGVRYGNRVAGYAEFGFGFLGLINGGLSIQL